LKLFSKSDQVDAEGFCAKTVLCVTKTYYHTSWYNGQNRQRMAPRFVFSCSSLRFNTAFFVLWLPNCRSIVPPTECVCVQFALIKAVYLSSGFEDGERISVLFLNMKPQSSNQRREETHTKTVGIDGYFWINVTLYMCIRCFVAAMNREPAAFSSSFRSNMGAAVPPSGDRSG